jgi:hypothetical protein
MAAAVSWSGAGEAKEEGSDVEVVPASPSSSEDEGGAGEDDEMASQMDIDEDPPPLFIQPSTAENPGKAPQHVPMRPVGRIISPVCAKNLAEASAFPLLRPGGCFSFPSHGFGRVCNAPTTPAPGHHQRALVDRFSRGEASAARGAPGPRAAGVLSHQCLFRLVHQCRGRSPHEADDDDEDEDDDDDEDEDEDDDDDDSRSMT